MIRLSESNRSLVESVLNECGLTNITLSTVLSSSNDYPEINLEYSFKNGVKMIRASFREYVRNRTLWTITTPKPVDITDYTCTTEWKYASEGAMNLLRKVASEGNLKSRILRSSNCSSITLSYNGNQLLVTNIEYDPYDHR